MKSTKSRKLKFGNVDLTPEEMVGTGKIRVTMFLDEDIVRAFKAKAAVNGTKYQTLINSTLREQALKPVVRGPTLEELAERIRALEKKRA